MMQQTTVTFVSSFNEYPIEHELNIQAYLFFLSDSGFPKTLALADLRGACMIDFVN